MNSTPCANACERNDSKESTPLRFIKKRIMRLPMPNIFICDNFSFKELDGSIMPNILPKKSFCTLGFCTFFKTFSPQKVKKMVTFCPVPVQQRNWNSLACLRMSDRKSVV